MKNMAKGKHKCEEVNIGPVRQRHHLGDPWVLGLTTELVKKSEQILGSCKVSSSLVYPDK